RFYFCEPLKIVYFLCAPVAQLAEATDSKPVQCEFESHQGHQFNTPLMSTIADKRGVLLCSSSVHGYCFAVDIDLNLRAVRTPVFSDYEFISANAIVVFKLPFPDGTIYFRLRKIYRLV